MEVSHEQVVRHPVLNMRRFRLHSNLLRHAHFPDHVVVELAHARYLQPARHQLLAGSGDQPAVGDPVQKQLIVLLEEVAEDS